MRVVLVGPALLIGVMPIVQAREAQRGPVAVMPFKDLNQDPSLEWLRLGIAETLISDLKKGGRIPVVERSQVDQALAEIALQGAHVTEASTAAQMGKLVGAKTVILGSFQQAGRQLRITARFVAVETGIVADTAKVTGKTEEVFSLQDQVASRLLGADPSASGAPKARPVGPKVLKAYRLYAMSLSAASDADKVSYLRQSLEVDPNFVYAEEDLKSLEAKLHQYRRRADEARYEQAKALTKSIVDDSTPPGRTLAEGLLLDELVGGRAPVSPASRVRKLRRKVVQGRGPTGKGTMFYAEYLRAMAQAELGHFDQARQMDARLFDKEPELAKNSGLPAVIENVWPAD